MAREVSPRPDARKPRLEQLRERQERLWNLVQLQDHPGWQVVQADFERLARTAQADVEREPDPGEQPTTRFWRLGYWTAMKNVAHYVPLAIKMAELTEAERAELARG